MRRIRPCLLICAVVAILVFSSQKGDGAPAEFSVSLTASATKILVGEPVVLTVTICYKGTAAIEVSDPLDRVDYEEFITIQAPHDPAERQFLTEEEAIDALMERLAKPRKKILPQTVMSRIIMIWCWNLKPQGARDPVFAVPGEYRIRYAVRWGSVIYDDALHIQVRQPETAVDQCAWERISREEAIYFLQHSTVPSSENLQAADVVALLQRTLADCPGSTYSRYIESALARYASRTVSSVPKQQLVAPVEVDPFIAGLEAQRYDVRAFLANPPAAFAEAQRTLFDQFERGTITDEDLQSQWRSLLETSITELTKPLSEEEWKRRQEQYRAEDAARRAEDYRRAEKLKPLLEELRKKLAAKEITVDEYNERILQEQLKLYQESATPDVK